MEQVILVDEQDNEIGTMEKMQAHVEGRLHRAISVFIFNGRGEMLLQQRAAGKYHSPLLWTNACCSHPRPGEATADAAHRRLNEEMGITCNLFEVFSFTYKAEMDGGLTEHEYDHVFLGISNAEPRPRADEAAAWKHVRMQELQEDMKKEPAKYTAWFRICMNEHLQQLLG
jgi:isopentenyl-diphosphate delta-isomerase